MHDPTLCEKCGRCCVAKLIIDGEVVYTPFPCPYLDPETKLCTVYDHRLQVNPQCLTVEVGIQLGVFPPDCPYVRDIPDYVPPRMGLTAEEIEEFAEEIRETQDDLAELRAGE
jgi:uncharacterized cysteine cluster protein YcgN (CxxCxxCC family)